MLKGTHQNPCRSCCEEITFFHAGEAMNRQRITSGSTLADVVRVNYVMPDGRDFEACWPVLRQHFGKAKPAAMVITAGLLDPRMKIEIEVTALKATA
jgi:enamine deaminase RidA (YjgF/YER057c/UK114 family)